jgi:hypothetical protein
MRGSSMDGVVGGSGDNGTVTDLIEASILLLLLSFFSALPDPVRPDPSLSSPSPHLIWRFKSMFVHLIKLFVVFMSYYLV